MSDGVVEVGWEVNNERTVPLHGPERPVGDPGQRHDADRAVGVAQRNVQLVVHGDLLASVRLEHVHQISARERVDRLIAQHARQPETAQRRVDRGFGRGDGQVRTASFLFLGRTVVDREVP